MTQSFHTRFLECKTLLRLKLKIYLGNRYLKQKKYHKAVDCFCSVYTSENNYLKEKIAEALYYDIRRQTKCKK